MKVGQYVVLGNNAWKISGVYLADKGGQSVVGLLPNKPTWHGGNPVDEMLVPVELVETGIKPKIPEKIHIEPKVSRDTKKEPMHFGFDLAGGKDDFTAYRVFYDWGSTGPRFEKIEPEDTTNKKARMTLEDFAERMWGYKRPLKAADIIRAAATHMEDRRRLYDKPGGERSMAPTVAAFNAITGHQLSEEQGWLFMELLKCVRAEHNGYRPDNYEDGAAYVALKGEAAARNRGESST